MNSWAAALGSRCPRCAGCLARQPFHRRAVRARSRALGSSLCRRGSRAVPRRFSWAFYLSLMSAGQIFFDFQWDTLLLESTLVAILVVPWTLGRCAQGLRPAPLGPLCGLVAPLPAHVPVRRREACQRRTDMEAPYGANLPLPDSASSHRFRLVREPAARVVPEGVLRRDVRRHEACWARVCLSRPRKVRHAAAMSLIFLQVVIAVSGNYAFFNLVTIGLCLACLDDDWWRGTIHWEDVRGRRRSRQKPSQTSPAGQRRSPRWCAGSRRCMPGSLSPS